MLSRMFGLETERLTIRPWNEEDRPALVEITSDGEVMRYLSQAGGWDEQKVTEFLERQTRNLGDDGVCMGATIEKATGRLVGIAGIQRLGTTEDFEIGWIFSRDAWGRGFATEAGRAARDHVLEVMRKPRVVAIIDPENVASKRVAERLGMAYDRRVTGEEIGHRMPEIVVDLYIYPGS